MPCAYILSQFEKDPKLTMYLRTCLIDKPQVAQHTERDLQAQLTGEEPLNISLESPHIEVSLQSVKDDAWMCLCVFLPHRSRRSDQRCACLPCCYINRDPLRGSRETPVCKCCKNYANPHPSMWSTCFQIISNTETKENGLKGSPGGRCQSVSRAARVSPPRASHPHPR